MRWLVYKYNSHCSLKLITACWQYARLLGLYFYYELSFSKCYSLRTSLPFVAVINLHSFLMLYIVPVY